VFKVVVPPLRDRKDDILQIAESFIKRFCSSSGKPYFCLSEEENCFFEEYSWPGNIRELRNICERYVALKNLEERQFKRILPHIMKDEGSYENTRNENADLGNSFIDIGKEKKQKELGIILTALKDNSYNKSKTAEALGVSRVTLWRKMKAFNIDTMLK